jgi:YggT family protein
MGWTLLLYTLQLLQLLIFVRVILSWVVSPVSRNPWVELLRRTTDPIINPIRSLLPDMGPVDFSPMVALLLISLLQNVVARAAVTY